jgi:PPK2 family polyphosphate:nucleotide phosphotransferase
MIDRKLISRFRVRPGTRVDLGKYPTDWVGTREARRLGKDEIKRKAEEILARNRSELAEVQNLLYADDTRSVLIVFQALDAAGKDGTIRHVMSGVNPQGCQVFSFKHPSQEELDHNFLWRYTQRLPERGRIGIFNRSYYEEVLVVKVHPEILARQKLPAGDRGRKFWEKRYRDINNLERHLAANGTTILKFFLHLSKEEQRKRFLERLDDPEKNWKFSAADVAERDYWKDYQKAFEEAISATSTTWAPWYVIPADRKYVTRALVAEIIISAIRNLDLKYPKVPRDQMKELAKARKRLESGRK